MVVSKISDAEFTLFQRFIYDAAGITLTDSKKTLVYSRLHQRLVEYDLKSYGEYFHLLTSGQPVGEVQIAIDLLTTNETYFFREPKHFELLEKVAIAHNKDSKLRLEPFRVWSAASSTGEEAYSIAMVLSDRIASNSWEVMGSDISSRVLKQASKGHYPVERTKHISPGFLKRFCLKGINDQKGTVLMNPDLRSRVKFMQINLNMPLPQLQKFDIIFLRNVMIYFSGDTKREVVARIVAQLKPGGYLLIGHSESLNDIPVTLSSIAPSIYRNE